MALKRTVLETGERRQILSIDFVGPRQMRFWSAGVVRKM